MSVIRHENLSLGLVRPATEMVFMSFGGQI